MPAPLSSTASCGLGADAVTPSHHLPPPELPPQEVGSPARRESDPTTTFCCPTPTAAPSKCHQARMLTLCLALLRHVHMLASHLRSPLPLAPHALCARSLARPLAARTPHTLHHSPADTACCLQQSRSQSSAHAIAPTWLDLNTICRVLYGARVHPQKTAPPGTAARHKPTQPTQNDHRMHTTRLRYGYHTQAKRPPYDRQTNTFRFAHDHCRLRCAPRVPVSS